MQWCVYVRVKDGRKSRSRRCVEDDGRGARQKERTHEREGRGTKTTRGQKSGEGDQENETETETDRPRQRGKVRALPASRRREEEKHRDISGHGLLINPRVYRQIRTLFTSHTPIAAMSYTTHPEQPVPILRPCLVIQAVYRARTNPKRKKKKKKTDQQTNPPEYAGMLPIEPETPGSGSASTTKHAEEGSYSTTALVSSPSAGQNQTKSNQTGS